MGGCLGVGFVAGSGCAHYSEALGYRAREAASSGDVEAFERLMAEAAATVPSSPRDNPTRTVLSHFLALGGDERFLSMVEGWLAKGWISSHMECAIHRARYRGLVERDPAEALEAAETCVQIARESALTFEESWQVAACLDEAPFLTASSTTALLPFLAEAADPTAPRPLREALLRSMTTIFVLDLETRMTNDPEVPRHRALRETALEIQQTRDRFEAIFAFVAPTTDESLLASATAFGALEIERASQTIGETFLGEFPRNGGPLERDIVWNWIREMKQRKAVARLASLGVWDRTREPASDAFWFVCAGQPNHLVLLADELLGIEVVRARCREEVARGRGDLQVEGPFPLASTARIWADATVPASAR